MTEKDFLVEVLARADAGEGDVGVRPLFQAGEADEIVGEVHDLHGFAHNEGEDLTRIAERWVRRFVETRLAMAEADLRQAEDRLEWFLRQNRQFGNSPELTFERERLQRGVSLKQQVFTTLSQSYEEVRIREMRNTPVITMIEQPTVNVVAEPRGRAVGTLLGVVLGCIVGTLLAFLFDIIDFRRRTGDPVVAEFLTGVEESRSEIVGWIRKLKRQKARKEEA